MNDDIPYIYLPFVKDTVDMTQPQLTVDADIQLALNGQGGTIWNGTDWGSQTDFWKFLITRYGHYRIMQQYTEEVNDELICDPLDFNVFTHPVLVANREKYNRLAASLKTSYDVVIVGSGIAGLYAALNFPPTVSILMLSKKERHLSFDNNYMLYLDIQLLLKP